MFRLLARTLPVLALLGAIACGDDESPFPGIDTAEPIVDGEIVPIAGNADSFQLYSIVVPAGATELLVTTSGGTGDPDIFVSRERAPTFSDFDGASEDSGTSEEVTIVNPQAGTWYILVHGYPPQAFAGVTLIADVSP